MVRFVIAVLVVVFHNTKRAPESRILSFIMELVYRIYGAKIVLQFGGLLLVVLVHIHQEMDLYLPPAL